ncbi:hypothetical protein KY290_034283 [Solanum tuberosum]|uniref:Uncharacterized protein n=1 Tax=Solanum tuberosum TaxID=4113 RepID=A0ABQ7U363_SOLTU|nr:hypothetical protein KY290_034283 [Solanum tuberosum]
MTANNSNQNLELIHGVGNFPIHSKKPAIAAAVKKPLKFDPADDIKKPFVNKHKSKPTKLRLMISNLLSKLRRSRRMRNSCKKEEKILLPQEGGGEEEEEGGL